jgi:amino acid transporter
VCIYTDWLFNMGRSAQNALLAVAVRFSLFGLISFFLVRHVRELFNYFKAVGSYFYKTSETHGRYLHGCRAN